MTLLFRERALLLGAIVLAGALTLAATAANTVPSSYAAEDTAPISLNALAPTECGGITLDGIVAGGGDLNGTPGNDLVLGASSDQLLLGDDGDDCLVAGAGADTIEGGPGNDVCIGTALATFIDCESFFVW